MINRRAFNTHDLN